MFSAWRRNFDLARCMESSGHYFCIYLTQYHFSLIVAYERNLEASWVAEEYLLLS